MAKSYSGQIASLLDGREFDESGADNDGSYTSVTVSGLSDLQTGSDWIDVTGRIRASIQAVANSESQDVRVRGKVSFGAEPETVNEATGIATGAANATDILAGRDVEKYAYLQIECRDNDQSAGDGTVDIHGNLL